MVKHPSSRAERLKIKRKKDEEKKERSDRANARRLKEELKLRETDDDLKNIDDISWQPERRYRVISQE